nr:MAG TPA: hypothetical protein [Caudoviricetes sp.]
MRLPAYFYFYKIILDTQVIRYYNVYIKRKETKP